jgi:hypothetical protein
MVLTISLKRMFLKFLHVKSSNSSCTTCNCTVATHLCSLLHFSAQRMQRPLARRKARKAAILSSGDFPSHNFFSSSNIGIACLSICGGGGRGKGFRGMDLAPEKDSFLLDGLMVPPTSSCNDTREAAVSKSTGRCNKTARRNSSHSPSTIS